MYINKIVTGEIKLEFGYLHVNENKVEIEKEICKHLFVKTLKILVHGEGNCYGLPKEAKTPGKWTIEINVDKWIIKDKPLFTLEVFGNAPNEITFEHNVMIYPYDKYLYLLSNDYREFLNGSTINILQQY